MDEEKQVKTGTTTVGITFNGGVVFASDRRVTAGTLIAHKNMRKTIKVDENMAITTAGLVGDAQQLARFLKSEVELHKMRTGAPMTIKAAATMMANILNEAGYYGYEVQLLLGGVDSEGSHVYSIDSAGGSIPDKYASTGSGSPYVYGVLEEGYKEDMGLSETINLALRCVSAAMKRDSASGEMIDVAVITDHGFKYMTDAEVNKRLKKLGIELP